MKKLLFVTLMLMLVFSLSNGLYSQSTVDEDDDVIEEEKPQTRPAKKYDLTPKFYEDMTWKESLELSETERGSYSDRINKATLSGNAKVTKLKNNKPTEIVLSDFGGKATREKIYHEDDRTTQNEDDIDKFKLTLNVDAAYKLSLNSEDLESSSIGRMLVYYPAGNLLGFEAPMKGVGVGDTWSSKTLYPANFEIMEELAREISIKIEKSDFKLVSVNKKKNVEIAKISWTGTFTMGEIRGNDKYKIEWSRTVEFDLTNSRLLTSKGSFTVEEEGEEDEKVEVTLNRVLTYEKPTEEKKEEPKLQPKTDDE